MKKVLKRYLSVILVLTMVFTTLNITAYAAPEDENEGIELELEALDTVWTEVVDATERKRVSRTLAKGERASVADAPLPLSVAIGRREAASVSVRGKPYDLTKAGSGSVVRFQVK